MRQKQHRDQAGEARHTPPWEVQQRVSANFAQGLHQLPFSPPFTSCTAPLPRVVSGCRVSTSRTGVGDKPPAVSRSADRATLGAESLGLVSGLLIACPPYCLQEGAQEEHSAAYD